MELGYLLVKHLTIDFVPLLDIIIALIILSGIPYALSISAILSLCTEYNAFEKSINMSVSVRFFSLAPSMILLTVSIYLVVNLLVLKPCWLILNILSTSGILSNPDVFPFFIFLIDL